MTSLFQLITKVGAHRYMIRSMAVREIRSRYVGSIMGVFWSVVHPILMVGVYWFVFSIGFKVQPSGNIPFVVWFFCAFVPWTTFNEMITTTTNSVTQHQALVKRTLFPSEVFPFIYLVSSAISHLIMLVVLLIMLFLNGIPLSWYNFQFLYYWFAMMLGAIGLGWLFAALNVFIRDIGQLVSVGMQIWFWGTPIFWQLNMLPERYHFFLQLNPMYYIAEGYRNAFLYHKPFWEGGEFTLYFWAMALSIFLLGGLVFKRLKPEFADVL